MCQSGVFAEAMLKASFLGDNEIFKKFELCLLCLSFSRHLKETRKTYQMNRMVIAGK